MQEKSPPQDTDFGVVRWSAVMWCHAHMGTASPLRRHLACSPYWGIGKAVLRELPHALVCGLLPWLTCTCPKKCTPFRCSKPACAFVCVTEACPGQMALAGVSAAMVAEPSLRALGLWTVPWQFHCWTLMSAVWKDLIKVRAQSWWSAVMRAEVNS